jgi:hypothetical protein
MATTPPVAKEVCQPTPRTRLVAKTRDVSSPKTRDVSSPIAANAAIAAVSPTKAAASSAPLGTLASPEINEKTAAAAQTENTAATPADAKLAQVPDVELARSTKVVPVVDVPDGQLRTELQSLLVGVDLASVTVGQLRGRLEQRLGLGTGALASRKRLRRQVSWAVQEEVAKKAKRSTDCDRIVKALIEYEEYPEGARQMLIDSLPEAVSYSGEPHPHQARLLQIVSDALVEARRGIEDKIEVCQAGLRSAEKEHQTISGRTEEANAIEADKAVNVTAAEEELKIARECVRQTEEDSKQASLRLQSTADDAAALRDRMKGLRNVVEGPMQTLLDGAWTEESARDADLGVLQEHLGELGAESAMLDAVAVALVRRPPQRGVFDNVTATEVKRLLVKRVEELTTHVMEAESKQVSMEAEALAASSMLGVTRERSEASSKKLQTAREHHASAVLAVKAAVVQVASSARMVELCISEKDLYGGRRQELNETIAIVQRLIDGSSKVNPDDDVTSAAIDDAASANGAASDTQDVAMPSEVDDPVAAPASTETHEQVVDSPMEVEVVAGPKVAVDLNQAEVHLTKIEIGAAALGSPDGKNRIPASDKTGSPHGTWPPPTPQRTSMGGRIKGTGQASPLSQTD